MCVVLHFPWATMPVPSLCSTNRLGSRLQSSAQLQIPILLLLPSIPVLSPSEPLLPLLLLTISYLSIFVLYPT